MHTVFVAGNTEDATHLAIFPWKLANGT
jgi:hypothetical protein